MATGTTTTTSARSPWEPVQPYITGGIGIPGVLPSAVSNFQSGGWNPAQQAYTDMYTNGLGQQPANNQWAIGAGQGLLSHGANAVAPAIVGSAGPAAQGIAGQAGGVQRDSNMNSLLQGDYKNPYLDQMYGQAARRMGQAFNEQVMPGIGQQAQAAGQYGGSRQGIAEGIAARGQSDALGDLANNMYGNAYNQGFGARTQLTGQLAGLDQANQQFNAGQQTQTSLANAAGANQMQQFNANSFNQGNQFNANLGLQNNTQNLSALTTGADLMAQGQNANNNNYQNMIGALGMPSQYGNANLNNYANLVNQSAGQGGSSTQQNPYYTNNTANNLGLAASAAALYKTFFPG